jgi:hypothetical protein
MSIGKVTGGGPKFYINVAPKNHSLLFFGFNTGYLSYSY